MTNQPPIIKEQYTKGNDVLNFVVYKSTTLNGEDEVLQHKQFGLETAHITIHPGNQVSFRVTTTRTHLENIVKTNLAGFTPPPSFRLAQFIQRVKGKI